MNSLLRIPAWGALAACLALGSPTPSLADDGSAGSSFQDSLKQAGSDFETNTAKSVEQFKTHVREQTGQEEVGSSARKADGAPPSPKPSRKSKRRKAK